MDHALNANKITILQDNVTYSVPMCSDQTVNSGRCAYEKRYTLYLQYKQVGHRQLCKALKQYLLSSQVSKYCWPLALQSSRRRQFKHRCPAEGYDSMILGRTPQIKLLNFIVLMFMNYMVDY